MNKCLRFLLPGIMLLFLVACTNDEDVEDMSVGDSDNQDSPVNDYELAVAVPSDAVSLDPHGSNDIPSEQFREVLYEGLTQPNGDLEVVPQLAEDWEEIDETTWHFYLKEDVIFHDGSEFNAEVVKANIERLLDPAVASPRAFLLESVSEVVVIDDYTVEFKLKYPFSPLLNTLTHGAGKMISKDLIDADYENALSEAGEDLTVEEYYKLREEDTEAHEEVANAIASDISTIIEQGPVGTNYLQFESRNPGEKTVFKKYEDYWDGMPAVDSVTYTVISEIGSRMAELETGASDFVVNLTPDNVNRVEGNDDLELFTKESTSFEFIGFNTAVEPFDDVRVRQAISHAFDKEAALSGIYNNFGKIAETPLNPGVIGYSEGIEGLDYDMDLAKQLLEEAGYEDGFDLTLMVQENNPQRIDLAIFLQESLSELNINVEIEQLEFGTFLDMLGNGQHDMYVLSWFNLTGDGDNALSPLFHSKNLGPAGNMTFYENEELDLLLDKGRQVTEEDERQEIYEQAQQILIEDAPMIYFRYGEELHAYSTNIAGIEVSSYNLLDFRDVNFSE